MENVHSDNISSNDITTPPSSIEDPHFPSPMVDPSKEPVAHSSSKPLSDTETTLEDLPDAQPGEIIGYPLHKLIQYAIQGSQLRRLRLEEIVAAISAKFPSWYDAAEQLHAGVEWHLKSYDLFVSYGERESVSEGTQWWKIDPSLDPNGGFLLFNDSQDTDITSVYGRGIIDESPTQRFHSAIKPPNNPDTNETGITISEDYLKESSNLPAVSPQPACSSLATTSTSSVSELGPLLSPVRNDITTDIFFRSATPQLQDDFGIPSSPFRCGIVRPPPVPRPFGLQDLPSTSPLIASRSSFPRLNPLSFDIPLAYTTFSNALQFDPGLLMDFSFEVFFD
ncbi:hypothetical protein FRC03_005881 [Tulasnella sp. 419]|nr:hypothetical protein FRC03_005881 [Tulasnella sp. 419]